MKRFKENLIFVLMMLLMAVGLVLMATAIGAMVIKDTVLEWRECSWSEVSLVGTLLVATGTISYLTLAPAHMFWPIPITIVTTTVCIGLTYLLMMAYAAAKAEPLD